MFLQEEYQVPTLQELLQKVTVLVEGDSLLEEEEEVPSVEAEE